MVDGLKGEGITGVFTSLTGDAHGRPDRAEHLLSSLTDTWLSLRDIEAAGERNRTFHLLKSRGMAHSNQVREYTLTAQGMQLAEVYVGPAGGVLTGSARLAQETREQAEAAARQQEVARRRRTLAARRAAIERQIAELRSSLEQEQAEVDAAAGEDREHQESLLRDREAMRAIRGVAE
jgi:circadian clock protein KaiC